MENLYCHAIARIFRVGGTSYHTIVLHGRGKAFKGSKILEGFSGNRLPTFWRYTNPKVIGNRKTEFAKVWGGNFVRVLSAVLKKSLVN